VIRSFASGGRRLRPLFCHCGWTAAGGDPNAPAPARAGAALELFHSSALVHDDIADCAPTRRDRRAVHRLFADLHPHREEATAAGRFGTGAAVLVGDLCLAWSDELLQRAAGDGTALHRAAPWISAMRAEAVAGQFLDGDDSDEGDELDRAWRVVQLKSAACAVQRPLQIGAALAGADEQVLRGFSAFGHSIGAAFQLRDDVLGVFGDPATASRPAIDDLREGKPTVLVALARERADASQGAALDALHGDPHLDDSGAEALRGIIRETGAAEEVAQLVADKRQQALAALEAMRIEPNAQQVLAGLASTATVRAG
jgi:geranylgeranyl diphosphate synthase type I